MDVNGYGDSYVPYQGGYTIEEFIDMVQTELTIACALPKTLPDVSVRQIIEAKCLPYFYRRYQYAVQNGASEALTRTMVFTGLVTSNVFLTLLNRSFYYSIITTLSFKNNLVGIIIGLTVLILSLILFIPPIRLFFEFEPLSISQLAISISIGTLSVIWFELVKLYKRTMAKKNVIKTTV